MTHGDLSVMPLLTVILMLTISYGAIIFAIARMYLLFRRKFNIETSPNYTGDKAGRLAVWRDTLKRTLKLSIHTLPYTIWTYQHHHILGHTEHVKMGYIHDSHGGNRTDDAYRAN